jgi:hypothetical protein
MLLTNGCVCGPVFAGSCARIPGANPAAPPGRPSLGGHFPTSTGSAPAPGAAPPAHLPTLRPGLGLDLAMVLAVLFVAMLLPAALAALNSTSAARRRDS